MREPSSSELLAQKASDNGAKSRDLRPLLVLWPMLAEFRRPLVFALIAMVAAALMILGFGLGLRAMVDYGLAAGNTRLLDRSLIVMVVAVAVLAASSFTRLYYTNYVTEHVIARLRQMVFDRLLYLDPAFFTQNKVGDLLARLVGDTTVLQSFLSTAAPVAIRNGLVLLGGLVMMLIASPHLTGWALLVVPVTVGVIVLFARGVRRASRTTQDKIGHLSSMLDETLHGLPVVQAFGQEKAQSQSYGGFLQTALVAALTYNRARAMMAASAIFLVFTAICAVLWLGGHDVLQGRLSAGTLSSFVFYAVMVAGSVASLSEVWGDLQRASGAMERVHELLQQKPETRVAVPPLPVASPAVGRIEFINVSFAYPTRLDHWALRHVNLVIEPQQRVALVGPSGCGKSTIVALLLRWYDPQEGQILLDGVDIKMLDPKALRRYFGWVPQEPILFSGSVLHNIAFSQETSDAELVDAARSAHALDFIAALPNGWHTELGERGARLSGGQKQRIALARALLRQPKILLLDEATNALDAESEAIVQAALDNAMQDRGALIIAHRLSTIKNVDRIVVMDNGKIAEQGNHVQLVKAGGLYARLVDLQLLH